jgi:hypothetical protein
MCADFDFSPSEWTAPLCERAGAQLDAVMGHCEGFPGGYGSRRRAVYFEAHNAPTEFTVAGYRQARVDEVREALRLQRALAQLALRAQAEKLQGPALREAWRQAIRP